MAQTVNITVTGGYNGGAVISAKLDGVEWFNATGNSPYNLIYDITIGTVSTDAGTLDLLVTPPPNQSSNLTITLSGALNETINVPPNGLNTSYGYNFTRDYTIGTPVITNPVNVKLPNGYIITIPALNYSSGNMSYTDIEAAMGRYTNVADIIQHYGADPATIDFGDGGQLVLGTYTGSGGAFGYQFTWSKSGGSSSYAILCKYGSSSTLNIPIVCINSSIVEEITQTFNAKKADYDSSDVAVFSTNTIGASLLKDILSGSEIVPDTDDPYAPGGYSGDGGGDGSFNLQNDSIDFPNLPTLSAVDTGLVSIYTPSLAQLKSLATFLWNANPTDVDWWKKLVANPLDLILGLSIVPVEVPAGTAQNIKVGLIDTGVSVTKAARQFVTVDCGSVTIQKNCGGSALDFSPFTKFSLYLPFIGTRTISCDDIMGRTVHVKYNVDLLSGGCTAMVKITGGPEDNELDAILYQYSGACAISIPLTGETFTNMITSTIQLAASIGATVATGGAAAGVTAASAANSLMSMKPIIERAGGVSGAAGQLGIMQPYLIAEVPRQSVPENCNKFTGYPSNMKAVIGSLTGYTEVEIIYIKGIEATQAELDELETILKGGFII